MSYDQPSQMRWWMASSSRCSSGPRRTSRSRRERPGRAGQTVRGRPCRSGRRRPGRPASAGRSDKSVCGTSTVNVGADDLELAVAAESAAERLVPVDQALPCPFQGGHVERPAELERAGLVEGARRRRRHLAGEPEVLSATRCRARARRRGSVDGDWTAAEPLTDGSTGRTGCVEEAGVAQLADAVAERGDDLGAGRRRCGRSRGTTGSLRGCRRPSRGAGRRAGRRPCCCRARGRT